MADISRKMIPSDREIVVVDNSIRSNKCGKTYLLAAISEITDDEEVVSLYRKHGFVDAHFANESDEKVWIDQVRLVVRSYRPETDEEYLIRHREEERLRLAETDKERTEYLRLKAKFEKREKS